MFATLKGKKHSSITLGELRHFINDNCRSLPNDTPIEICDTDADDFDCNCNVVIADDDSITFYNR